MEMESEYSLEVAVESTDIHGNLRDGSRSSNACIIICIPQIVHIAYVLIVSNLNQYTCTCSCTILNKTTTATTTTILSDRV